MDKTLIAAAWGLAGAIPYAFTVLATALWGAAEVPPHARKRAMANCVIATFTGPAIAGALGPWLVKHAYGANLGSVSIAIGLSCNAIWPIFTDRRALLHLVSTMFNKAGAWLTGMGRSMDSSDD